MTWQQYLAQQQILALAEWAWSNRVMAQQAQLRRREQ